MAAKELVRFAQAQGLSLTGPERLLKQLTKNVLEIAPAVSRVHSLSAAAGDCPEPARAGVFIDEYVSAAFRARTYERRMRGFSCVAHEGLTWRLDDDRMRASILVPRGPRSSHGGRAMIETLVPASACTEMFSDAPESTMFSIEAAAVANAVAERRREFGTVRYCARKALLQVGVPAVPILPDVHGAPRWPVGVVGSMTHCAGYRAAAVARSDELFGVGIDAEPHGALPKATLDLILRDEERVRLLALADAYPDVHWDRVLFCAKEAVYKAWFPLTRRWLDFADVSTTVHLDGTFCARLRVRGPRIAGVDLDGFSGRWVVGRGLVVAATSVGRCPAARVSTPLARCEVRRRQQRAGRPVGAKPNEAYVATTPELGHVVGNEPRL
jgi:4'-phosphopantetheinyl transferase EntD